MKRTDTEIHHIEMLLTLDYLLRFSDEQHPATQQSICEHANDFGLKYDKRKTSGNDVRRDRVGACLKFLMDISEKYSEIMPFVLETTDSGKYYIDQKNYLSEEQVLKVLAAIQNDKYTQDEESSFLIERLLDTFSNFYNRDYYKKELSKLNKGVRKFNKEINRKIRLVNKAYVEEKILNVQRKFIQSGSSEVTVVSQWYRVYSIKEYKGKPYALLLPINANNWKFSKGYVFCLIEDIPIADGKDKEVLCADFVENRDLDALFKQSSHIVEKYYDSPELMLLQSKMPLSGMVCKASFYYSRMFHKAIKSSFEELFSEKLVVTPCSSFTLEEETLLDRSKDVDYIHPVPLKENEKPKYCVVNTLVDSEAFLSWLISSVNLRHTTMVCDLITVVAPKSINRRLYAFYLHHAKSISFNLPQDDIDRVDAMIERYEKRVKERNLGK